MKKFGSYVKHILVISLTVFSLLEVIIGFLPFKEEESLMVKVFFMGLTIIGVFYEIVDALFSDFTKKNNLSEQINQGLIIQKERRFGASVLLDLESNLSTKLKGDNSTEYRIIIVTSCLRLNEYPYVKAIWNNIRNNCKYMYITPDDDQKFINSFIDIFSSQSVGDIDIIYQTVTKQISHICDGHIFDILPECYDMCIYYGIKNGHIDFNNARGFACYQNEAHSIGASELDTTYYVPLSGRQIEKIIDIYSARFTTEKIMQPYISKKAKPKNSNIHGIGLFCTKDIMKGEIVFVKGGYELHRSEMFSQCTIDSYLPIGDDLFLSAKTEEEAAHVKLYINHSCDPNLAMLNDRTFCAIRHIKSGEELTIDYAFVDNEDYSFECHCGSPKCRKTITGFDWKESSVRRKYKKTYFSPYLQRKI